MENGSFWECVITVSKISAHSVSAGIKHSLYITSLAFLSLFPVAFSSHVSLFGLTALSLHPRSRSATGTLHVGVCEPGSFPFCHPHPLCQQARTLTEASAGAYYWKEHLSERAGAAGGSIAKRGEGGGAHLKAPPLRWGLGWKGVMLGQRMLLFRWSFPGTHFPLPETITHNAKRPPAGSSLPSADN